MPDGSRRDDANRASDEGAEPFRMIFLFSPPSFPPFSATKRARLTLLPIMLPNDGHRWSSSFPPRLAS